MPCSGSTTMPTSRRSSPQTCSSSSASWRPSTQILLAAATWARRPGAAATAPEEVVVGRAAGATDGRRSVTGHPFVDVWAVVRPSVIGLEQWPDVPPGQPWKEGLCRALAADPTRFWPQLRNRVRSYADLRPELVGAVERLIDFVAPPV